MASLSDLSVQRPVLATVMSLAIVIGGLIGFQKLGVREFPVTERPVISVSTSLRGANASVVENQVTEPLEASINAIEGVETLTSRSSQGSSNISAEFALGTDLDAAAAEVRDRVSRARGRLPDEVEEPVISKAGTDSQPVVFLTLSSPSLSLLDLTEIADNFFAERLQTIDGIASVDIWGEKRPSMRLWLDPARLAAYRLTASDVRAAVAAQNVELPGGRIEGNQVDLSIRPMTRLSTPEEFENLVLRADGATLVRFRDVGRVTIAPQNDRGLLRRNGTPMVGVVARPLPGANAISIADEFRERVETIRRDLPPDVEIGYGFDNTVTIRAAILEVQETLAIALGLVVLVIFLFLRDWRTTLVPILVIPVSIVGAFGIMALAGFTINVLTLLALVLAIGLVVDDAIIVLENIYVKVESGMTPREAALVGTREIFVAVVATTLALVVVFLPIVFQGGLVGSLFREFGLTLAGAVVISSFAALTLTPMLSARLLRRRAVKPWVYRKTEPFFEGLTRGYANALRGFLSIRWMAFVLMAVCSALIVLIYTNLEQELAPQEDRSQLRVSANAPQGRGYGYMRDYMARLEDLVRAEVPEATSVIGITGGFTGGASGFVIVVLPPADERERTQDAIAQSLQKKVRTLPGARVSVTQTPSISTSGGRGSPVQFVVQAPTLDALRAALPAMMEKVQASDAFSFARADLEFTLPELQVDVDRTRALALGISPRDVGTALSLALSEQRLGYFIRDGEQYEIIAQLEQANRSAPDGLRSLYLRTPGGAMVQLDAVVTAREAAAPPQLTRYNRFTSATINAQPADGVSLGAALAEMDRIADETLPDGFSRDYAGQSKDFRDAGGSVFGIFALAILLIYLVLAAQFESFRDPFIVLLTVPLALVGALGALWYFDATINVFSQIGIVMLVGLVTKNGILIVEFARQRQESGLTAMEAAAEAAAERFRPVLMTSLATILGTLPIALALGAGAESRVPMGLAVVGGLVVGTFLTLFVIPALYSYLAGGEHRAPVGTDAGDDLAGSGDGAAAPAAFSGDTPAADRSGDGADARTPTAPALAPTAS